VRRFLRRTRAVAHKEVLHIVRDRRAVYLALGLPVVMLVLFGFGISLDIDHIPTAIVDEDRTPSSRRVSEALVAGGSFARARELAAGDQAEAAFRRGDAKAVLVIPRDFQRHLARGESQTVQLLLDGSDGTTATIALGDAQGIFQALRLAGPAVEPSRPPGAKVRIRFNPAMRSSYSMVSGVVVLILALVASLLTALTVSREWERGSMEQLFATPVSRTEIVTGKLLPYAGLGVVQILLVVTVGTYLFDVPIRGSLAALAIASLLFLLTMLGTGLLISIAFKNQLVAVQFAFLISYLPSAILSGFIFPLDNMPLWLRALSRLVPARYFLTVLRGALLKGNGAGVLWPDLAALAVFALAMFVLAVRRFRRRLA
jgi:ABC-2 type transport system permease protein